MMYNIFRNLAIDSILATKFGVFYIHARIAALIFTTLSCILFCPPVVAQLTEHLQAQSVVSLDNVYQQYTAQLWAGLVVMLLVTLLTVHLVRTKAKLA